MVPSGTAWQRVPVLVSPRGLLTKAGIIGVKQNLLVSSLEKIRGRFWLPMSLCSLRFWPGKVSAFGSRRVY